MIGIGSRGTRLGTLAATAMFALTAAGCSDGAASRAGVEAYGQSSNAITFGSGFQPTPWRFYGEKQGMQLGGFITGVGDVNGDGYDDLALGTPLYDPPGESGFADWGRVQLFLGSANGLSSSPSQTLYGTQDADRRADPVRAGDVNGDGYADVFIQGTLNYIGESGVYLHLGGPEGLSPAPVWHMPLQGEPRVLGPPGDLTGDGLSDVMISKVEHTPNPVFSLQFFAGTKDGLATEPFLKLGEVEYSASGLGDFTGDGLPDIAMGRWNYIAQNVTEAEVFGFWGMKGGLSTTPNWNFVKQTSHFAEETERLGDVNGDGIADVGFSSHTVTSFDDDGEANVFHGGVTPSTDPAWSATFHENVSGWLDMAGIGDADGDGYNDMLLGLDYYFNPHNGKSADGYPPMGRARVYFGGDSGIAASAAWSAYDEQLNHNSFANIAKGAGDVNGDGFADIAIGDHFAEVDRDHQSQGFVYVYYGAGGSEPVGRVLWSLEAHEAGTSEVLANGARAASADGFDIAAVGLGTMGRTSVRLEVEVKPAAQAFDGTKLFGGSDWLDTGTAGVALKLPIRQLDSNTTYKYRVRLVYRPSSAPLTRHSRWFAGSPITTNCDATDPDFDGDGTCNDLDEDDDNDGSPDAVDCAPKNRGVAPGKPELVDDGIDQDCSGKDSVTCYVDADHDGFGSAAPIVGQGSCATAGTAATANDCDDAFAQVHPGAEEVAADSIDQDCDGKDSMLCYADADQDGYGGVVSTVPMGTCQGNKVSAIGGDCRDDDPASFPGASEVVGDGIDQNCSGNDSVYCYTDADRDGYGRNDVRIREGNCQADGLSASSSDCDDDDATIHLGASEVAHDGVDQDCDGVDAMTDPETKGDGGAGGQAGQPGTAAAGSSAAGASTAGAAGRSSAPPSVDIFDRGSISSMGTSDDSGCACRMAVAKRNGSTRQLGTSLGSMVGLLLVIRRRVRGARRGIRRH